MILFFDLTLDHLAGNLHCHAADLILHLIDSFSFLLCNVALSLLFHSTGFLGCTFQDLLTLEGSCPLCLCDNITGLCFGLLHILFILCLHGKSFFLRLCSILDFGICH